MLVDLDEDLWVVDNRTHARKVLFIDLVNKIVYCDPHEKWDENLPEHKFVMINTEERFLQQISGEVGPEVVIRGKSFKVIPYEYSTMIGEDRQYSLSVTKKEYL